MFSGDHRAHMQKLSYLMSFCGFHGQSMWIVSLEKKLNVHWKNKTWIWYWKHKNKALVAQRAMSCITPSGHQRPGRAASISVQLQHFPTAGLYQALTLSTHKQIPNELELFCNDSHCPHITVSWKMTKTPASCCIISHPVTIYIYIYRMYS